MSLVKPKLKLNVVLSTILLSVSCASYAQTTSTSSASSSAQTLCCDKNAQGKCVIPMPNRPSPSRVSEPGRYADVQKRLDKLDTGNCAHAYSLNKAQAWLNMSRDVHHEGDGSAVSGAAFDEAEKLIKALEEGKTPSLETAMIQNADKLRPDLWEIVNARKATPALLSSAAREVAYCEIYLVRAGYAQAKLGGKARVEPLIGMAQDICAAAKDKPTCPAPVVVHNAPVPVPAAVIASPAPIVVAPPAPVYVPQAAPKRKVKQDRN